MNTPLRFLLALCITVLCGFSMAAATPSIAFVPLDNRPPCMDHVLRLAAIAGADLRVPPYKAIGAYSFSGNPDQVEHWLDTLEPAPDYLIISLDMLAYGGLVASRVPDTPEPEAIARLAAIEHFTAKNPRTQIFAFGIIQRIARTATGDPEYDGVTDLISKYLKLNDHAKAQNDAALAARAAEFKAKIPEQQLADYLAARTRNHAVNRAAVALAASGVLDYLVLAMDDNAEYGPHRPEREVLSLAIQQAGAADRVLIKPGADEVGQLLLARAVNHARRLLPRIALHFVPPQAADWIAPLEDRPLSAMAAASLQAAGATVATDKHIHGHLIVYAGDSPPHTPAGAEQQAADLAAKLSGRGRAAGVADVRFVNKSDAGLAALLLQNPGPAALSSYAGWNTAGNAFGTAAAHLLVAYTLRLDAARGADVRARAAAHAAFLLQRFADDYPDLWREFHYVPGMSEWSEKTFGKNSLMNQKYNSFAMYKYAFSFRDRDNKDLRLVKSCLRSSMLYAFVFFLTLPLIGILYAICGAAGCGLK